jgi:hypothetical protein
MKQAMTPIARRVRAYFAPVDRGSGTPALFDDASTFDFDAPPAPWIAAGDAVNFRRTGTTKVTPMLAGAKGAVAGQFRSVLGATISADLLQWGKLQIAVASGSQHMNVLSGSAVAMLAGSSARELVLGEGAVDAFNDGDMVACDVDYQQQTGYIGSPSGAYVKDPADLNRDRDYLRRITFNVARVTSKTATALQLDQPLPGGAPATGASAQKVVAFSDREGGSFFQEWSALFTLEPESGGRLCFYYPRVQSSAGASEKSLEFEQFEASALHVELIALPVTDLVDREQVVCYRTYFPASGADLY